ncbi:MAG: HIT family protein [Pseudomonadota bacterium]
MTSPSDRCIFCRILAETAPASRVYETDQILVFMDLFPVETGHTLIIPKPHWENIFEMPPSALRDVVDVSKPIAEAIRKSLAPEGIQVFQLNGAAAGQTVFHYHMHLIPRWQGGAFAFHGRHKESRATLDEVAASIRAAL